MKKLRHLLLPLGLLAAAATPTSAATVQKYDAAAVAQAKAQGRSYIVDVKAWWCPVCWSQNKKLKKALVSPKYDKVTLFEIDFDKQKDEWRALGVRKQATLIGYHRGAEIGRVQYDTDEGRINALLAKTAG